MPALSGRLAAPTTVPIALQPSGRFGDHRAVTRDHKHRPTDSAVRDRADGSQADAALDAGNPRDLVRTLQQQAGNAAVAGLMGGVQRAPKLGPGDELMSPDGELVPVGGAAKPAAKTGANTGSADPGAGGADNGFEAGLYEQALMGPLRAAYACVRDSPPDFELANEHLQRAGQALWDYEQRYRGTDDALANGFYAARGWLGRVAREIGIRLGGSAKPMSDDTMAAFMSDTIADLNGLQDRLH